MYDPFEKFGLRRTINAATCLTTLGGSQPDPTVFEAMIDASKAFIYIPELQNWAGKRLAEAFGAEAGLPTAGAVNSLMLACAACIMRGTKLGEYNPLDQPSWAHIIQRLPMHTEGLPTEFVVMADSRTEYDHAIEAVGGKPVEAGTKEGVTIEDLHKAFKPGKTAAYYYTLYAFKDQVPIKDFVEVAHSHGVPAIVDAAPTLTHKGVPKKILEAGVDLLIFSGGKQFGAPNNTGILLGRADLIKLAHLQAYPFDGIGRASKMCRETIVALVTALELFMKRDDDAYYTGLLEKTKAFSKQLDEIPGVSSGVLFEPLVIDGVVAPCYAWIENENLRKVYDGLLAGSPSIKALYEPFFITNEAANRITLKTEYLLPGDTEIILNRIKELLGEGF
ncbi:MAG: aminotransferase class V-fold PLP-dependent enzyme [Candidatus Bathyarchaeota archaeon]|nr:aminotransferase class V-fold PLP-dependent enzyme [Candidatus Bathyarchaeota archaeon]